MECVCSIHGSVCAYIVFGGPVLFVVGVGAMRAVLNTRTYIEYCAYIYYTMHSSIPDFCYMYINIHWTTVRMKYACACICARRIIMIEIEPLSRLLLHTVAAENRQ